MPFSQADLKGLCQLVGVEYSVCMILSPARNIDSVTGVQVLVFYVVCRSVQMNAKKVFPPNVDCFTIHSLAWKAVGCR